ncbi:hypothetical protein M0208_02695 [Sphingomonas sp. SUN019]|uniref:hypothetical protein n=1 Tax=Sphingomonas sp. SUN019 TaxID=2937788 RepID=UPI0021646E26|nr:hypothetical protein [Sphingomonas sp. SUN019]UVO49472.1 hypothetical protein M0208_02695 [Sphingomonas sp. SUN019]
MNRSTIAWNISTWSLLIALAVGACGKFKETEPAEPAQTRAEAKRHKDACASSTAYDRMKRVVFDQTRAQSSHRTNLNTLEAFSFVRMEAPIVKDWDPTLDLTRCKGRLILDAPPGSGQALGGERRLTADIEYTAQGAADASGLVYVMTGEEAIVSKLAAFNLSDATYRPRPAVDTTSPKTSLAASDTGPSEVSPRVPFSEIGGPRTNREAEEVVLSALSPQTRVPDPRKVANATEPQAVAASVGEDTVRTFYNALGTG